jgi:hypothetical protein
MKKFWIVMLAVARLLAFTAPVIAAVGGVDVQFSGTYRVRGWYDDNVGLMKANENGYGVTGNKWPVNQGQAFYDNRLRIETTFKVAEGLKLVTRFDALEKKWGQTSYGSSDSAKDNGNIYFERAYVSFTTGLGTLNVGYQDWSRFGTQFIDSDESFPGIKYINTFGPLTVLAGFQKRSESMSSGGVNQPYDSGYMDIDSDLYVLGGIFKFKGGEAGLLAEFLNDRSGSQYPSQAAAGTSALRRQVWIYDGYAKFKAGPVYVEAEGFLATGGLYADFTKLSTAKNQQLEAYGAYINAEVDLKPLYVGAKYIYVTGDDPNSADKREGNATQSYLALGTDHDFALMYGNYEYFNQVTANGAAGGNSWRTHSNEKNSFVGYGMENANSWQIYAGIKPTPKIDVRIALTDAWVQTAPVNNAVSTHVGTELDLRASYKIFDNLTYSVGAGYFFTGEYFKGTDTGADVSNDYLLMHQLLLSF